MMAKKGMAKKESSGKKSLDVSRNFRESKGGHFGNETSFSVDLTAKTPAGVKKLNAAMKKIDRVLKTSPMRRGKK